MGGNPADVGPVGEGVSEFGNFQYNAFRLADMATEVQLGRTFLDSLVRDHIHGQILAR